MGAWKGVTEGQKQPHQHPMSPFLQLRVAAAVTVQCTPWVLQVACMWDWEGSSNSQWRRGCKNGEAWLAPLCGPNMGVAPATAGILFWVVRHTLLLICLDLCFSGMAKAPQLSTFPENMAGYGWAATMNRIATLLVNKNCLFGKTEPLTEMQTWTIHDQKY